MDCDGIQQTLNRLQTAKDCVLLNTNACFKELKDGATLIWKIT